MADMTGGLHSSRQRQRDRSLAERVDAQAPSGPVTPKPCWLAPHAEPVAAHVLGWVPDSHGAWRAIVVVEVAGTDVAPRPPTADQRDP